MSLALVGAGPGSPALLTLRAHEIIRRDSDVVLHDSLVPSPILSLIHPSATVIDTGKRKGSAKSTASYIRDLIREYAGARRLRVARLKGGDPLLFGRAEDELDVCARIGVPVEIVPGVSSALAAAAAARVLLTPRCSPAQRQPPQPAGPPTAAGGDDGGAVGFFTARRAAPPSGGGGGGGGGDGDVGGVDFIAAARLPASVFFMGAAAAPAVARGLLAGGAPAWRRVAAVENAALASQRVVRTSLGALAAATSSPVAPPALLIVGGKPFPEGEGGAAAREAAPGDAR